MQRISLSLNRINSATKSSIKTNTLSRYHSSLPTSHLTKGDTTTIVSLTWTIFDLQTILCNKISRSASLELHNISRFPRPERSTSEIMAGPETTKAAIAVPLTCHGHSRPVTHLSFSGFVGEDEYYMISACKGMRCAVERVGKAG